MQALTKDFLRVGYDIQEADMKLCPTDTWQLRTNQKTRCIESYMYLTQLHEGQ